MPAKDITPMSAHMEQHPSSRLTLEFTSIEAQGYADALDRLCNIWYAGKKHDKHLLQKHLGQYNALKGLIKILNNAIRESEAAPQISGGEFDVDLARENESEAQSLFNSL